MTMVIDKLAADLNKELLRRRYPAVRCVAYSNRDETTVEEANVGQVVLIIGRCEVKLHVVRLALRETGRMVTMANNTTLFGANERLDALEYVMTWFERLWNDLTDA